MKRLLNLLRTTHLPATDYELRNTSGQRMSLLGIIATALFTIGALTLGDSITREDPREIVIKVEPIRPIDYAALDRQINGKLFRCEHDKTWTDPHGRVAFKQGGC